MADSRFQTMEAATKWDTWAQEFDDHVCDIAASDSRNVLGEVMKRVKPRRKGSRLLDLGCGRGTFIRKHAGHFTEAIGVDFSEQMIRLAAHRCRRLRSVRVMTGDARNFRLQPDARADVVACFNVATSCSKRIRNQIWKTVSDCLKDTGVALLVVPALESAARIAELAGEHAGEDTRTVLPNGVVEVDGIRQKFFRADEIRSELDPRLHVMDVRKVWYPWSDEGLDPRRLRGIELPWDWLVLSQRKVGELTGSA